MSWMVHMGLASWVSMMASFVLGYLRVQVCIGKNELGAELVGMGKERVES